VVRRCASQEPRHGEVWTSVSKHVKNWKAKTCDILGLAAAAVSVPV